MLRDQQHVVLEEPDLNVPPTAGLLALVQRSQRADRAEHPAHDVVDAAAGAQRSAFRAGHVGEAAHHLHDFIERSAILVGAGQKALVRDVNQARD